MSKYMLLCLVVVLLAACTPKTPTGMAVSQLSGGGSSVQIDYYDSFIDMTPVRVTVKADIVYNKFIIDNNELFFSAENREWVDNTGSSVVYLTPGKHTVKTFSCVKRFASFDCGCISGNDCGYWIQKTIYVP